MKTTIGIVEGEWQGEHWFQYRWSCRLKDSEVLYWMNLHELDKQSDQKQEWSEKDEKMANDLIKAFLSSEKTHHLAHTSKEIVTWLISLKNRMRR